MYADTYDLANKRLSQESRATIAAISKQEIKEGFRMFPWLEKLLYELPPPNRGPRSRGRFLCLGPGRPGTESLRNALLILGYDAVFHRYEGVTHGCPSRTITLADIEAIIGDCETVTDMPCVNVSRELIPRS